MSGAHWPRARAHELEKLGAQAGAQTPVFQGERERDKF